MRIFENFPEAFGEIARDLREMGIHVKNKKMQDKEGAFHTYELCNYGYTVLNPDFAHLEPTQPWAEVEWEDRLSGIENHPSNPGEAVDLREDDHMIWADYLEIGGRPLPYGVTIDSLIKSQPHLANDPAIFAYTYSERFAINQQVWRIIRELRENPDSRQLYVSLWDPHHDCERLGVRRVPCSLGWHFLFRNERLHVTYFMRSCDFVTHFQNDVWLTLKLLHYVAENAGFKPGRFSQFINSFHVYEKDVKDVF